MKMKRWTLKLIIAVIIATIIFLCSKIIFELCSYPESNRTTSSQYDKKENINSNYAYYAMAQMYLAQGNWGMWNFYMSMANANGQHN